VNRALLKWFRQRGATREEVDEAAREGRLALLALDREILPGRAHYSFAEVTERAGVEPESALRLWRALGFPDPPEEARFGDEDVRALTALRDWFRTGAVLVPETFDRLVQQTRVVGAATSRLAEGHSDAIMDAINRARDLGMDDEAIATVVTTSFDWSRIARFLDHALRIQLRAALWRKYAGEDTGQHPAAQVLAVGFVDLVGYTALSQELDEGELAALIGRFDALAYDTVAEHGGRVVKTIGDEVMFVAYDSASAARIALALVEGSAADDVLPESRAGVAFGPAVAREGDYYGPVVNLARRLVDMAKIGAVLVSDELHETLADDPGFSFRRLRSRRIRDIGRVEVWRLRPAADDEGAEPAEQLAEG
jgi:adenylate cyclase